MSFAYIVGFRLVFDCYYFVFGDLLGACLLCVTVVCLVC